MKFEELKDKTVDQLKTLMIENKKELMNLRFQLKLRTLSNTSRMKYVRKYVARIKTLLKQKKEKLELNNA